MEEIYDGDIYTLTDETGKESEFELIGSCEFEGKTYLALVPVEPDQVARRLPHVLHARIVFYAIVLRARRCYNLIYCTGRAVVSVRVNRYVHR